MTEREQKLIEDLSSAARTHELSMRVGVCDIHAVDCLHGGIGWFKEGPGKSVNFPAFEKEMVHYHKLSPVNGQASKCQINGKNCAARQRPPSLFTTSSSSR